MDIPQLAQSAVDLLVSQLPQFRQLGWKIPEGVAAAIGASLFDRASALWNRLRGKAAGDPGLQSTLDALQEAKPEAREQLRAKLNEVLQQDPAFAAELAPLIRIEQNVSGQGNITAAGDLNIENLNQSF